MFEQGVQAKENTGFASDTVLLWVCSVPGTWKARSMNRASHCEGDNTANHKSNYFFHILSYILQPKKLLYFRCVSVHQTTKQTCIHIVSSVLLPFLVKKDQGTAPVPAVERCWCPTPHSVLLRRKTSKGIICSAF